MGGLQGSTRRIHLTQEELGHLAGLSRQTVNRVLRQLEALRIVSLGALAPYAAARESAFVFARLEEARRRSKRVRAARLSAGVRFTPLEMKAGS